MTVRRRLADIAAFTAAMLAAPQHTGVMVALYPTAIPDAWLAGIGEQLGPAARLTPGAELHVTLAYLGERTAQPRDAQPLARRAVEAIAARWPVVAGELSGLARFTNAGEDDALVALYDSPLLPALRQDLVVELWQAGLHVDAQHGFTAHMTLAYLPPEAPTPAVRLVAKPLPLPLLKLAWGADVRGFPLRGGPRNLAVGVRNT